MKSARRRSRELATQGLYQWLLSGAPGGEIDAQLRGAQGFDKADHEHLDTLLHGVIRDSEALSADLAPCLDRPIDQLSPVERAVLLVAAYELKNHVDIPSTKLSNSPRRSAAPTATSTSTACWTSWRRNSALPKRKRLASSKLPCTDLPRRRKRACKPTFAARDSGRRRSGAQPCALPDMTASHAATLLKWHLLY
jgi:hypothetical protein